MCHVSVIIPTWNAMELLCSALDSLQAQTWQNFETIVVDNGSTDGTPERITREYSGVRLIRFETNRGFAPAVNAGIKAARGDILVLMNNDTEADPNWLEALVRALSEHAEVGFCASKVLQYHDRSRIDSAGDCLGLLADQVGHGEPNSPWFDRPRPVFSACAGAAAYRREVFQTVGYFDERFFAYTEDVDFGARAQLAGFSCLYVPDAIIYHVGSATGNRNSGLKSYLLFRNSLRVFFQYMPRRVILRWGFPILLFPLIHAARQQQSPGPALRAILTVLGEVPEILRRRTEVRRTRAISEREFLTRLSAPLGPMPARSPNSLGRRDA